MLFTCKCAILKLQINLVKNNTKSIIYIYIYIERERERERGSLEEQLCFYIKKKYNNYSLKDIHKASIA